ncbi:MAG: hypothetical protein J5I65_14945 [Aridibacter famidurans]|nr:hypothetical protein [Aridibacter famidurans]
MQLIRCTAKLLKEMGLKAGELQENSSPASLLGQWHANLIYIDRRKTVLFVNDRTLINFIVPGLARAEIRDLPKHFRLWLSCVLAEEAVPALVRERILAEYDEIRFAKSSDRSVLGACNDLAFHYKFLVTEEGGIHSPMVPQIIRRLNRMPMKGIDYRFPIDELARIVESVE